MSTRLTISTAFHPQTDGRSKRTIQVLEDMLRACVLDHKGSWEEHLPLMEFAYNNSYQASIQMAPYEALYRRPCRSSICWTKVGESSITGPDLIRDTSEKVSLIRQRLLTDQSRQKSYADVRRRTLEFMTGPDPDTPPGFPGWSRLVEFHYTIPRELHKGTPPKREVNTCNTTISQLYRKIHNRPNQM